VIGSGVRALQIAALGLPKIVSRAIIGFNKFIIQWMWIEEASMGMRAFDLL